jgi:hypothetical protein
MSLREFSKSGTGSEKRRVLVELAAKTPTDADLFHLAELGLEVERCIGNKIVGAIAPSELETLRDDELVRAVELSETLKLHGRARG